MYTTAQPIENASEALPLFKAIELLILDPVRLFRNLELRPRWGVSILAYSGVVMACVLFWSLRVDSAAILQSALEKSGVIDGAQIEHVLEYPKHFFIPIMVGGKVFAGIVIWLVASLGMMLVAKTAGSVGPGLASKAMGVAAYAQWALLPRFLFGALICAVKGAGTATLERLSPTSIGYFLHFEGPMGAGRLGRLDIFQLFWLALIFLGLRKTLRTSLRGAIVGTVLLGFFIFVLA